MIDSATIYVKAGEGGSGCNSFIGKKFTRSRHPDGGNGGKGADVIIRTNRNIQTLEKFRFNRHFKAENGRGGGANKKQGANARICLIEVPPGTVIRDAKDNLLMRDLVEPGEELVVAKGGAGGRGNTGTKEALVGSKGEEKQLLLELKLVADIGLISYPNAGKSTLMGQVSSAQPKVGSYPFTTKSAVRGVITFADYTQPQALTIIEIPALVSGAHQGKGLGTQFLRHAERAQVLVHLVDLTGVLDREPFEDFQNLNQELLCYSPDLAGKRQVIVCNKIDLPQAKKNFKIFSDKISQKAYPVSALTGEGIAQLLEYLRSFFKEQV